MLLAPTFVRGKSGKKMYVCMNAIKHYKAKVFSFRGGIPWARYLPKQKKRRTRVGRHNKVFYISLMWKCEKATWCNE